MIFCACNIFAQNSGDIAGVIKEVKKGVLPIFCHDSTWTNQVYQSGTCIALGEINKMCFLTCEHVVAIKDSARKIKRNISDFYVQVNNDNDSTFEMVKLKLIYTDEKKDFALLVVDENQKMKAMPYIHALRPTLWRDTKDLNEGETVLYMGYPVLLGREKANHSFSKLSIISQLVHGQSSFLIDGFVQQRHSGSPVFLLEKDNTTPSHWNYSLIGIAASFPSPFGYVYESVNTDELQYKNNLLNPGFTNVIGLDDIKPVLKKFGF